MLIAPIRTDADLRRALTRIDELFARELSPEEQAEFDVLADLVEHYEAKHHPVPPADPVETIRMFMTVRGLNQQALASKAGLSPGRVSEVLHRKRGLTMAMVHKLAAALSIPASALMGAPIQAALDAAQDDETELDKLVKHVAAEAGIEPAQVPPVLADAWNQSHRRNRTVAVGWHEPSTRNSAVAA
ncbi:MAG: hypothetical protein RL071_3952 [Pseudomonadota bacterium]|jgi:HTH-type transcriptional regulator/antitoxin HigA